MHIKSLGEPIGGTGNIYAWGESQILKLYGDGTPAGFVERLGEVERALFEAGLPVPAVGEIIEVEGCLGQVYERIEGCSLAEGLLESAEEDPDKIEQSAHTFAEAHATIHACEDIPELVSQRQLFSAVIPEITVLPPELKEATLNALAAMPIGDRLCHGDFHPYNVLLSSRGPIVIDWNNAHIGDPLEDVARSVLILSGVSMLDSSRRSLINHFAKAYLQRYFQLRPGNQRELRAWQPIVAAVRLTDEIPGIQEWLIEQIRTGLARSQ